MLLTRREPDHIPRTNLLDRSAPALCEAAASRHDQGLSQWVGVPCCPSTRLERDTGTKCACWIVRVEQGVNADSAAKGSAGPLAEGCEPLRLMSIFLIPSLDAIWAAVPIVEIEHLSPLYQKGWIF